MRAWPSVLGMVAALGPRSFLSWIGVGKVGVVLVRCWLGGLADHFPMGGERVFGVLPGVGGRWRDAGRAWYGAVRLVGCDISGRGATCPCLSSPSLHAPERPGLTH